MVASVKDRIDETRRLINGVPTRDIICFLIRFNYQAGYLDSFDNAYGTKGNLLLVRISIIQDMLDGFHRYGLIMREDYDMNRPSLEDTADELNRKIMNIHALYEDILEYFREDRILKRGGGD